MQQLPVILHLYLCKTWAGNIVIIVYNFIVFGSSSFPNFFRPHSENAKPAFSNSSGLKSVFESLFRDG